MRLPTISLRALFLLGFAVGMPVLALPAVARRVETLLYGPAPAEFQRPASARPLQQVIEPERDERVSPASFDDVVPVEEVAKRQAHEGLDALAASPPPLAPPPVFPPLASETNLPDQVVSLTEMPLSPLGEPGRVQGLQKIRQELENLGAEYILLETTDNGQTYRFHCQMQVSEKSPFTRQFEHSSADPLAAGEAVLREVSTWRTAGQLTDAQVK